MNVSGDDKGFFLNETNGFTMSGKIQLLSEANFVYGEN
jgi:hypothetical protein